MIFKEFNLKQHFQLFLLLAIVSFVPLLLHAIAWDTYRIWSFPFMILFLGFWILSSKFKIEHKESRNLSTLEIVFFILCFLLVTLIPNILFDNEVERFPLIARSIIILPIFLILYFLKKPQPKD
jgi:predicted membrane channel-forming protein YqfA (hemolysin III family)